MNETSITIKTIQSEAKLGMEKTCQVLSTQFSKLQTGRANPSLLETIRVPQPEGGTLPLQHMATINVLDVRTLMVIPWDKSQITLIEKAILSSELGLNPVTAGTSIRVPLPTLSEKSRENYKKIIKKEAEQARNTVRHHYRQEAYKQLKGLLKRKEISEDQEKREQTTLQKLTNLTISEIDKILSNKERQMMTI